MVGLVSFVGNGLTHGQYAPGHCYHAAGVADKNAG